MDTVLTIVVGLLVLTVLVVAHEAGHFFVGRACNIRIDEFSVGFGPKLFSRIRKEIRYSIRCLPLGGYVQFYGEDADVQNEPRAFNNRPIWQRFLTILAGPVANIVAAVLLTVCVLSIFGDYAPVIKEVEPGTPAAEAGVQVGDQIIEIDGRRIDFSMEASMGALDSSKGSVNISVLRNGQRHDFALRFVPDSTGERYIVGIKYGGERVTFGFFEALGLSFKWMFLIIQEMLSFLGGLIFRGEGATEIAGPVGTISIIGQAVRSGPEVMMRIAALLSINLGIMNALPFPALDGGRIVLLGIEKLRGKPIPRDKEAYINIAGLVVLFGLMAIATYQDIARLIAGG